MKIMKFNFMLYELNVTREVLQKLKSYNKMKLKL